MKIIKAGQFKISSGKLCTIYEDWDDMDVFLLDKK